MSKKRKVRISTDEGTGGLQRRHPPRDKADSCGARTKGAERGLLIAACVFLFAITFAVFGQTAFHDFINFDDGDYVFQNHLVVSGLTVRGVAAAFGYHNFDNWIPLTLMSHMLDCQIYGLWAGGHHLTNVAIHAVSTVLLFLTLSRMTAAIWRSLFVAAVFAVHPLHVESVAWVAERKDVLSGLFFMLTLFAYANYARGPRFLPRYLWVAFFFGLGLMSKPMLVTLPFVLLLLDYWPLGRFLSQESEIGKIGFWGRRWPASAGLIAEKVPLLGMSVLSCVLTLLAQSGASAIKSAEDFPLWTRVGNAFVSTVTYIAQTIFPTDLAVFYPYPAEGVSFWAGILAFGLLAGISAGSLWLWRSRPYLAVGWFWYLGMLVPVIGLIQVGVQARADRYMYLPQIGLVIMATWGMAEAMARRRSLRAVRGGLAVVTILALSMAAWMQCATWRNSESLWKRALEVTRENFRAHQNLGDVFFHSSRFEDALTQYAAAVKMRPDDAIFQNNLASALLAVGRLAEAGERIQTAVKLKPDYADAYNNLGQLKFLQGDMGRAEQSYRQALTLKPDHAAAAYNLGNVYLQTGRGEESIELYRQALALHADYPEAHLNMGNAYFQMNRLSEAISEYEQVLALRPNFGGAEENLARAFLQNGDATSASLHFQRALDGNPNSLPVLINYAMILAASGDPALGDSAKALALAERANQLGDGRNPAALYVLAVAQAAGRQFSEAAESAKRARDEARRGGQSALASEAQSLLDKCQREAEQK